MEHQASPYVCHVWICVNDRGGRAKACADGLGMALKDRFKSAVEERGWKGRVRVSHSGCMGLCARGPNVMVQPDALWFSAVKLEDVPAILDEIARRHPGLTAAGG